MTLDKHLKERKNRKENSLSDKILFELLREFDDAMK